MLPDLQVAHLDPPGLVDLDPAGAVDVALQWQQWEVRTPSLDRVAAALVAAARDELTQPRERGAARSPDPR